MAVTASDTIVRRVSPFDCLEPCPLPRRLQRTERPVRERRHSALRTLGCRCGPTRCPRSSVHRLADLNGCNNFLLLPYKGRPGVDRRRPNCRRLRDRRADIRPLSSLASYNRSAISHLSDVHHSTLFVLQATPFRQLVDPVPGLVTVRTVVP